MLGVHFNQKMKLRLLKCTSDFNYLTETTEKKDRRGWDGTFLGQSRNIPWGGEDISLLWGAKQRRGTQPWCQPEQEISPASRRCSHENTERSPRLKGAESSEEKQDRIQ